MIFEKIEKPTPDQFARMHAVNAVCDYDPDICQVVGDYEELMASPVPGRAHVGQQLAPHIMQGLKLRQERAMRLMKPSEPESMLLLGIFTMAKFLEQPGILPGGESDESGTFAEFDAQEAPEGYSPFLIDCTNARRLMLHVNPADNITSIVPAPEKASPPIWSRYGEIFVEAKNPAVPTKNFLDLMAKRGMDIDPDNMVTFRPVMKARSTPITHVCTSKTAVPVTVIDLGKLKPQQ